MNTQIINYQFSVFGNFIELNPKDSNKVIELMELLKNGNFVPSTFGEIPINAGKIVLNSRFSFSNSDGVVINIGSERLDVIVEYNEDGKYSKMDYPSIKEQAMEYIKTILNKYKNPINRIALNGTIIYDDNTTGKIEKVALKDIAIPYYNENKPMEWTQRFVYQLEKGYRKTINIGINLSKSKGKLTKKNETIEFDNVLLRFDINTIYDKEISYDIKEINDFFDISYGELKKVLNSIEE